jgi:hypothetical protein
VRGHRPGHRFPSPEEGVGALLDAGAPRGGPFSYGLTRVDDVPAVLRARAGAGLHTIVNETVDVERPGTVALGHGPALALLGTVYGFTPDLEDRPGERVEFSIHPLVAGVRQTHTVLWELEPSRLVESSRR